MKSKNYPNCPECNSNEFIIKKTRNRTGGKLYYFCKKCEISIPDPTYETKRTETVDNEYDIILANLLFYNCWKWKLEKVEYDVLTERPIERKPNKHTKQIPTPFLIERLINIDHRKIALWIDPDFYKKFKCRKEKLFDYIRTKKYSDLIFKILGLPEQIKNDDLEFDNIREYIKYNNQQVSEFDEFRLYHKSNANATKTFIRQMCLPRFTSQAEYDEYFENEYEKQKQKSVSKKGNPTHSIDHSTCQRNPSRRATSHKQF